MAPETLGGSSLRRYIIDMARRDNLTIRQTYERTLPALGGPVFKGSAAQVADEMEDWWRSKAAERLHDHGAISHVAAPAPPQPRPRRPAAARPAYQTTTLRGHLGLPDAPSRWHAEQAAGERGAA